MKIGVISDTHGGVDEARDVITKEKDIDLWIHLGDYFEDGILLREKMNIDLMGVKGNCDRHIEGESEMVIELEGHKCLLVHGHQYGVKSGLTRLYYKALELGCDMVLYGHTHVPVNIKQDGVLIMNPGSLCIPRGGSKPSYGIIEIQGKKIHSEIISK